MFIKTEVRLKGALIYISFSGDTRRGLHDDITVDDVIERF